MIIELIVCGVLAWKKPSSLPASRIERTTSSRLRERSTMGRETILVVAGGSLSGAKVKDSGSDTGAGAEWRMFSMAESAGEWRRDGERRGEGALFVLSSEFTTTYVVFSNAGVPALIMLAKLPRPRQGCESVTGTHQPIHCSMIHPSNSSVRIIIMWYEWGCSGKHLPRQTSKKHAAMQDPYHTCPR